MARIPVQRDDLRQTPGFAPASADAFGAETNEALYRAGRAIQNSELAAIELETKRQIDSEQAAAAKGLAELEAGYAGWEIEAQQKAAPDGAGYAETAKAEFEKRRDAWLQSITRPEIRNWAEERAASLGGRADVSAFGFQAAARSAKLATDMGAAIDLAANNVYTKPTAEGLRDALLTNISAIDALTATPEVKAQLTTRAKGRLALSYLQGLREQQPYEARDVVKSGALNGLLDADQLSSIGNSIDSEIKSREAAARAEQAAARREAREAARAAKDAARDRLEGLRFDLDAGVPVDPRVIGDVVSQARSAGLSGTNSVLAAGMKNALNLEWRGARPADMQARINVLESEARAKGGDVAPAVLIERDHLQALLGRANAAVKSDPLSYAAQAGVAVPPIDAANPASFRARERAAATTKARFGGAYTVLTDEEAAERAGVWGTGSAAERMAVLDELSGFQGPYRAAAFRQVAGKDPVLGHAGWLLARPGGQTKARDIVAGQEILKANPKLAPVAEARDEARAVLGGALDRIPGAKLGVGDAARALYAARASRNGLDEFRPEVFERYVSSVLGENRGADGVQRGGLGAYRDEPVLLPSFMSADEFEGSLRRATAADFARAAGGKAAVWPDGRPVADAVLQRARVQAVGDGLYELRPGSGRGTLYDADGKPFVIDMRKLGR